MYKDEKKPSELAKFLSNYDYVFVDTCSLMDDEFPIFMDSLVASKTYWKEGLEVVILKDVENELKKHIKNKDDHASDACIDAKRALKILKSDKRKHLFNRNKRVFTSWKEVRGDGFADCAISILVTDLRISHRVLIITQDRKLATDLLNLNDSQSQQGRKVDVYRIKSDGTLGLNDGITYSGSSHDKYAFRTNDSKHNTNKTKKSKGSDNKSSKNNSNKNINNKKKDTKSSNKQSGVPQHIEEIKKVDSNLKANLNNPNLNNSEKIELVNKQINRINNISENDKKSLDLTYKSSDLYNVKNSLKNKKSPQKSDKNNNNNKKVDNKKPEKVEQKQENSSAKQNKSNKNQNKNTQKNNADSKKNLKDSSKNPTNVVNKKNDDKVETLNTTNSADAKKEKTVFSSKKESKVTGFDKTPYLAIVDFAKKEDIIIRDEQIEYVPAVHGKYNITNQELKNSLLNVEFEESKPSNLNINGVNLSVLKNSKGYEVCLVENSKNTNSNAPKSSEKKTTSEVDEPKDTKEQHEEIVKKDVTVPEVKTNENKKSQKPENKNRSKSNKTKGKKKAQGDKNNESPKKESSKNNAKSKKTNEKKDNKALNEKLTTKQINDKALADAKKSEKVLKANIKNPNYPKAKKVADLKAQRKKVDALTPRRKTKVEFTVEKIDEILKELK